MKKMAQTSIYNDVMKMLNQQSMIWDAPLSEDIYKILFEAMSRYLGGKKDKQKVYGVEVTTTNGSFIFGAFVTFMPSAEDETKGSYNLTFTFDKDSFESQTDVTFTHTDSTFRSIIYDIASRVYCLEFKTTSSRDILGAVFIAACESLKNYMIKNIDIDPQVELDEFFTATAQKDGNNVFISIDPSAVIKQYVKDDASLE